MSWFQVSDDLAMHHKAVTAGNAAMGLWVRAGSWCMQQLTEGFVPAAIARSMGTAAQIRKLIAAGLWAAVEGGYRFHEFGERQMSKDDIEDRRRKRAEAGRKGGRASGVARRAKHHRSKIEASASTVDPASGSGEDRLTRIFESKIEVLQTQDFGPKQPPPAESTEANEAKSKQNRTPVPYKGGHLGGVAHVSRVRAREIRENDEPPPAHHREHPGVWVPGCEDCDAVIRPYIDWLNREIAANRPIDRCTAHAGVPDAPPCGACANARRVAEAWDREHEKRLAADAQARRALVEICQLCDHGWRIPPPELHDAAPRAAKCNHLPGDLPREWRDLIAEQAAPTPTPAEPPVRPSWRERTAEQAAPTASEATPSAVTTIEERASA